MTKKNFLVFLISFWLLILPSLLFSQAVKFKGPGQPPTKVVEVSDDQMNQFLDQLEIRFDRKYSDLINKIRQAWNSRNLPQYKTSVVALILKIKNDVFGNQGPQPAGGCEQYLGWYRCYCGPNVYCCCPLECNRTPLNLCLGMDMGGLIGGGGGGGMYYICRPPGSTKR